MSLFFVANSLYELFAATGEDPALMFGMAVFFGVAAIAGGLATYFGFRPSYNKSLDPREIEQTLLGVARDLKGEITVEEFALHTPLTVSECKVILEKMVSDGAAEIGLGRHEETLYVFRGFLVGGKRTRSYDPFSQDETVFDLPESGETRRTTERLTATANANQSEPEEQ
jgi:hypothetical protein